MECFIIEVWNSREGRQRDESDRPVCHAEELELILVKVSLALIRLRNGDEESVGLMRHETNLKK